MANYESASVFTGDKEAFRLLKRHFSKEENHFGFYEADPTRGEIGIRNRHGATLDRLLHLSCLCRDSTLYANISYESERYERIHKYVVHNGQYETLEIEVQDYEDYRDDATIEVNAEPTKFTFSDGENPFAISEEEERFIEDIAEVLDAHFEKMERDDKK